MSLGERLQRLDRRERQLLAVLGVVAAVFVVLLLPVGVAALIGSKRADVEALRDAIEAIQQDRGEVERRAKERELIQARYSNSAPPLAGLLEKLAKQSELEIPESQDRAPVPHGKRYEERSTKIVLRKVGMLNLVKFMERIEQSPHPLTISRLNIRKRGTEPDSFDVEMIVSAFDRKEAKKEEKKGTNTDTAAGSKEEP